MNMSSRDEIEDQQDPPDRESSVVRELLSATVPEADQAPISQLVIRDLAVASIALAVFGGAHSWAELSDLTIAHSAVAFVGLIVGALLAGVGHEWGHLAGARLAGGHCPTSSLKAFPELFRFDFANNDRRAFIWLTAGGSVGHWAVTFLLLISLPFASLGTSALIASAVGVSVLVTLADFPIAKAASEGKTVRQAYTAVPGNFVKHYGPQALAAALVTFLVVLLSPQLS